MKTPSSRARRLIGRGVAAGALLFAVLAGVTKPLVFLPPDPTPSGDGAQAPRTTPHFTTLDPSALVEDWMFASMDRAEPGMIDPDFHHRP